MIDNQTRPKTADGGPKYDKLPPLKYYYGLRDSNGFAYVPPAPKARLLPQMTIIALGMGLLIIITLLLFIALPLIAS